MLPIHVETLNHPALFDGESHSKAPLPPASANPRPDFDTEKFLATIGAGGKVTTFSEKQTVFTQGDAADSVFYIQQGKVRLAVVSRTGKEATLGILGQGEFFGEGCLVGMLLRMKSATAMTDCELLRIDKKAMMEALHREQDFPKCSCRV